MDDKFAPLVPGMNGTAQVKTGKRRAIEFFPSRFLRYVTPSTGLYPCKLV